MSADEKETIEVTLPGALVAFLGDDAAEVFEGIEVRNWRRGSRRLRGAVEDIEHVHSRLWVLEVEAEGPEKAAYRRWCNALAAHGIRT
jgi:hypothetical protein